jgi:hypothetical protein
MPHYNAVVQLRETGAPPHGWLLAIFWRFNIVRQTDNRLALGSINVTARFARLKEVPRINPAVLNEERRDWLLPVDGR